MVGIDFKMPNTCGECPCCIHTADEKRYIGYCNTSDDDYYCKALDRFMEYDKVDGGTDILGKPSDCPLVEAIPKTEYEARLKAERKKIAEDVADKMDYIGSCFVERNIILGTITGKRETLDICLCSTCKSKSCVSNDTAISKADYEARLKADMMAMLEDLRIQMKKYEPKWVENDEQAVAFCRTWEELDGIIQEKINVLMVLLLLHYPA